MAVGLEIVCVVCYSKYSKIQKYGLPYLSAHGPPQTDCETNQDAYVLQGLARWPVCRFKSELIRIYNGLNWQRANRQT